MSLLILKPGYNYRAIDAMERLSLGHQRQIEWLRKNWLPALVASGKAKIFSNHPEMEYQYYFDIETLQVNVKFYLRSEDGEAVIFSIE